MYHIITEYLENKAETIKIKIVGRMELLKQNIH